MRVFASFPPMETGVVPFVRRLRARKRPARLARHPKFDLPLDLRNRDGTKVRFFQLLIEFRQLRLLELLPLRDAYFRLWTRFLINSNRLRRHSAVAAFDDSQRRF